VQVEKGGRLLARGVSGRLLLQSLDRARVGLKLLGRLKPELSGGDNAMSVAVAAGRRLDAAALDLKGMSVAAEAEMVEVVPGGEEVTAATAESAAPMVAVSRLLLTKTARISMEASILEMKRLCRLARSRGRFKWRLDAVSPTN